MTMLPCKETPYDPEHVHSILKRLWDATDEFPSHAPLTRDEIYTAAYVLQTWFHHSASLEERCKRAEHRCDQQARLLYEGSRAAWISFASGATAALSSDDAAKEADNLLRKMHERFPIPEKTT